MSLIIIPVALLFIITDVVSIVLFFYKLLKKESVKFIATLGISSIFVTILLYFGFSFFVTSM